MAMTILGGITCTCCDCTVTVSGCGGVVLPDSCGLSAVRLKFESCRNLNLNFQPFGDCVATAGSFDLESYLEASIGHELGL
jgi:hypothetical protein